MNLDDWLIQNENLTVEEINEILRGEQLLKKAYKKL